MSTQSQKVLQVESKGGQFVAEERGIPTPGAGEILVKIHATALNPGDWKMQKYGPDFIEEYPAILGSDIAGEVIEVGEGATGFSPGDRV